jgi:hypothetical protein
MNDYRVWQRVKRNSLVPVIMGLVVVGLVTCSAPQSLGKTPRGTQTLPPAQTILLVSSATNLDDDASQWGIFYDGGSAIATVTNVAKPSVDGNALEASLLSGQPYVGIHVYRNLPPADTATIFELSFSFRFPNTTPIHIQALEFTMNIWVNNQRWEWALQWENIGDGSPPPWRLWTGSAWQSIDVTQQLSINTWHKLHLKGNISHGRVHYISFSSDSTSVSLGQTFPPISNPGNKLAVAVQLDGDSHEDPYQVYIDRVDFSWR